MEIPPSSMVSAPAKRVVGRPIQKGQVLNPGGRPKLDKALREIKQLTHQELQRIISKYFRMTMPEIELARHSATLPAVEVIISQALWKASRFGNISKITPLIDRVAGKIKEEIEFVHPKPVVIESFAGRTISLEAEKVELE